MRDHLQVKIDRRLVGQLWLDERKNFCFQYNTDWLQLSRLPLSLSLPLQKAPFLDDLGFQTHDKIIEPASYEYRDRSVEAEYTARLNATFRRTRSKLQGIAPHY